MGRDGEEAAARLLGSLGLRILERNFRCRQGEVDLICRQGDTLVFVEVKTRAEGSLASGTDAVDRRKRSRIVKAASQYLSAKELWSTSCRFDVVSVVRRDGRLHAEHLPDAFQAESDAGRGGKGWQPW
nr:YraN family protein [Fundidesulfovibrio terrae]